MKRVLLKLIAVTTLSMSMAMVTRAGEIILGINVKNPALNVPINEQPYFGFAKNQLNR